MATNDESRGAGADREITNTAGERADADRNDDSSAGHAANDEGKTTDPGKEGDDAWHNDSNRSGERGEGAQPGYGGNTAD